MTIVEHWQECVVGIIMIIILIIMFRFYFTTWCQYCPYRACNEPYITPEMLENFKLTDEQRRFYKDAFDGLDFDYLDEAVKLREAHPVIYTEEDLIE